ncbi:hypothetical protein [Niabella beijingensis]|uniref:hypothetical protein n=1 Tax=Niabella beijingensis TaxID=2872700 RepID=UPI001CBFD713|nr:hypothetical protein [Niabella beijingensis]MBZ4190019.1 hypothetical protein [Niabella beijingensis]
MKVFKILLFSGLLLTLLNSCSKDDKPGLPSNNNKAKLTFTVSNTFHKAEGDDFEVSVGAGDKKGNFIDWMVNGAKKTGTVVLVGTDDFNGGKTIVIESASNFFSGNVHFGGFEGAATPFTVTWKIEVNGSTIEEGTQRVVKDMSPSFSRSFELGER